MPSKMHNVRVSLDGYTFDGKAEARRYQQLLLLEKAGEIRNLVVHPRYAVVDADEHGRAIHYVADFAYDEVRSSGNKSPTICWYLRVVEDVKGYRMPLYKIKMRLFRKRYPELDFREISSREV